MKLGTSNCKTGNNALSSPLGAGDSGSSQYINFKRSWTWKEGGARERGDSAAKYKCAKITPKYMEL
jgi:hypothetical protein